MPRTGDGRSIHPLYHIWVGMRQRCRSPRSRVFDRYGGRGITVCERWDDFWVFVADVGPRPGPEFTLDRIDNDGNYEPGNVRWATYTEQNRNRRPLKTRALPTPAEHGHVYVLVLQPNGHRRCQTCLINSRHEAAEARRAKNGWRKQSGSRY